MARLDDLVAQVADRSLRREMQAALAEMKRRQRFGLVFEDHIPETTVLYGLPIQTSELVRGVQTHEHLRQLYESG